MHNFTSLLSFSLAVGWRLLSSFSLTAPFPSFTLKTQDSGAGILWFRCKAEVETPSYKNKISHLVCGSRNNLHTLLLRTEYSTFDKLEEEMHTHVRASMHSHVCIHLSMWETFWVWLSNNGAGMQPRCWLWVSLIWPCIISQRCLGSQQKTYIHMYMQKHTSNTHTQERRNRKRERERLLEVYVIQTKSKDKSVECTSQNSKARTRIHLRLRVWVSLLEALVNLWVAVERRVHEVFTVHQREKRECASAKCKCIVLAVGFHSQVNTCFCCHTVHMWKSTCPWVMLIYCQSS